MTCRVTEVLQNGAVTHIKVESEGGEYGESLLFSFSVGREFFPEGLVGLCEGMSLSERDIALLREADMTTEALSRALDSLSYSAQSEAALVKKLTSKYKIEREYAARAAEYCSRRGYIDEEAQARRIARSCMESKCYGERRIAAFLLSKGYKNEAVKKALAAVSGGADGAAYRALKKKVPAYPEDASERRKAAAALIRAGHSPSAVERALERLREDAEI